MGSLRTNLSQFSESHGLIVLLLLELGMIFVFGRKGRGGPSTGE